MRFYSWIVLLLITMCQISYATTTAPALFYLGRFQDVLDQQNSHPQMRVLALANLGYFGDAAAELRDARLDTTHPMNAWIIPAALGDVPEIAKRLTVLPDGLRHKYTRLILNTCLNRQDATMASRLLQAIDPEKDSFFDIRFRILEQQNDVIGQLELLRAWAMRFPGDTELRTGFQRFALTTNQQDSIWEVLFPQETDKLKAATRAFALRRYSDTLQLLSGLQQPFGAETMLMQGMALFHTRKREEALAVFYKIPKEDLPQAQQEELSYQIGKTLQLLKKYDEAASVYRDIIASNSRYRVQTYYDLYWVYTALGKTGSFDAFEKSFFNHGGTSSYYEKWVWDSAWTAYMNGAVNVAYQKVRTYPWTLQDEFKAKVLFWTAEMADQVDKKAARKYREKCIKLYPFTYYGARLIGHYFPREAPRLSKRFVSSKPSSTPLASANNAYETGLGEYEAAILEDQIKERPTKLLDKMVLGLASLYERILQSHKAITLLGKMGFSVSSGQATLSREMAELMYPRFEWELIQELSETYGLDPYLVLALMREESLFNTRAVSRTGARGLMQIMPDTGRGIAKNLKVTWSNEDMLFDPETNIRFGVFYLSYLKKRFDGNIVYMLSGYNAGPNATHRWVQAQETPNLDMFVATIPYAETHHYVTRVLKSYWIYTLLYNPGVVPDIFQKG